MVKQYFDQLRDAHAHLVTTDDVLAETITLLFIREPMELAIRWLDVIVSDVRNGVIQVERVNDRRFDAAWQLRIRYRDKARISFVDLSSMVIMRELGIDHILTADQHFHHVNLGFKLVPEDVTKV